MLNDLDIVSAGYQFDYVFDWTILKYPQIGGSSSRGRVSTSIMLVWIFLSSWELEITYYNCFNNSMTVARQLCMQDNLHKRQKRYQVHSLSAKYDDLIKFVILIFHSESDHGWSGILDLIYGPPSSEFQKIDTLKAFNYICPFHCSHQ